MPCQVNLGPLLWHFSDMPNEQSVELSWEETRALIADAGFSFEKEEFLPSRYTSIAYRSCICCAMLCDAMP
jgi:carnosine N-methyltransferase